MTYDNDEEAQHVQNQRQKQEAQQRDGKSKVDREEIVEREIRR